MSGRLLDVAKWVTGKCRLYHSGKTAATEAVRSAEQSTAIFPTHIARITADVRHDESARHEQPRRNPAEQNQNHRQRQQVALAVVYGTFRLHMWQGVYMAATAWVGTRLRVRTAQEQALILDE